MRFTCKKLFLFNQSKKKQTTKHFESIWFLRILWLNLSGFTNLSLLSADFPTFFKASNTHNSRWFFQELSEQPTRVKTGVCEVVLYRSYHAKNIRNSRRVKMWEHRKTSLSHRRCEVTAPGMF